MTTRCVSRARVLAAAALMSGLTFARADAGINLRTDVKIETKVALVIGEQLRATPAK